MRQKMQYLYVEVKKTACLFPRMLLQAILLMVLIGAIAFCGVKGMEKRLGRSALALTLDVGVAAREDNVMTRMAIGYVEQMESLAKLCRFVRLSEEEGMDSLARGEVAALIVLPGQLIEGIMNGQNPSVEIYFSGKEPEALILRQLMETGTGLLQIAQAQCYGACDLAAAYGLTEQIHDMEMEIDSYNLAFVMNRMELYKTEKVSATGRMSIPQYYAATGVTLFLLFTGMAMYPVMQREPRAFTDQLMRWKTGTAWQSFCGWLCGFMCMSLFAGMAFIVLRTAAAVAPELTEGIHALSAGAGKSCPVWTRSGVLLLLMITAVTMIYLLYGLAGTKSGGILLIFLCSVAMLYLSGGFIPSIFLPHTMAAVGERLPTAYMLGACGVLFGAGGEVWRYAAGMGCYTVLFAAAAYALRRRS